MSVHWRDPELCAVLTLYGKWPQFLSRLLIYSQGFCFHFCLYGELTQNVSCSWVLKTNGSFLPQFCKCRMKECRVIHLLHRGLRMGKWCCWEMELRKNLKDHSWGAHSFSAPTSPSVYSKLALVCTVTWATPLRTLCIPLNVGNKAIV